MDNFKIAEDLLKIKAVRFRTQPPFTWSSGWQSPIYCDNRLILSYPDLRTNVKEAFTSLIDHHFQQANAVAGVATGAIAMAALIADTYQWPMIYIRSKAKSHGMNNLVEGELTPDLSYVVIEDLISTGGSSLQAVEAIREAGGKVAGVAAVFSYEFSVAKERFASANCPYFTLTNMDTLLSIATQSNYLPAEELSTIKKWQENPADWKA